MGPFIETANKETIAEGHKSVRVVLNAVLGDESEPTGTKTCEKWDCTTDATHTVEVRSEHNRFTLYQCSECIAPGESHVAAVDEGVAIAVCDDERCFNVVHESRAHCAQHSE